MFFSKQNAMIVLWLTDYLTQCLNHGDLKNNASKSYFKTTHFSALVDKIIIEIGLQNNIS